MNQNCSDKQQFGGVKKSCFVRKYYIIQTEYIYMYIHIHIHIYACNNNQ